MRDLSRHAAARPRTRRLPRWAVIVIAVAAVAAPIAAIVIGMRTTSGPSMVRAPAVPDSLRQVDGGPGYYARFPASLPSDASYFPIGVWLESVVSQADVNADKRAGLNLYVGLTANSDLRLVDRNGMKVIAQQEDWLARADSPGSQAIAGWLLADEVDMQMSARKGFSRMRSLQDAVASGDGRLRYSNYGKGVTFWNSDAQAARYVNEFQDVVSADNYWFTDEGICGRSEGGVLLTGAGRRLKRPFCHRAANYGRTVDRVRSLVDPPRSRPVWGFVEVGHPFSDGRWPSIEPAEVSAAVWSSLIHGARGIVYFNHSFGGPAPTQHALREPPYAAVRSEVARTNARIRRLAPVLNAPFVDRFAGTKAAVDVMTKHYGGHFYVFAASRARGPQRAEFHVPCAGDARVGVLDEDRTLELTDGSFEDHFADGNAVHIYRIGSDSPCWLPGG
jgi:hypothetical protein